MLRRSASRLGTSTPGSNQEAAPARPGAARVALVAYCIALVAFTVFVLLDTFAIQRVQSTALAVDTTSIQVAEGQQTQESQQDQGLQASSEGSASTAAGGAVFYSSHGSHAASSSGDEAASGQADTGQVATGESQDATAASRGRDAASAASGAEGSSNTPAAASSTASDESQSATGDNALTYSDENIQVSISTAHVYDTDVYIADVQVSSAAYLKAAFAQDSFGRNVKESTSNMAQRTNAVLAINGDYYGFRDDGYVLRNGVLYRDTPSAGTDALVVYGDGTLAAASQDETSAQQLLEDGAWQVLSFGPVLVQDGQIVVGEGEEVGQAMASNPRTAIGMVSPLHYIVVVSDGRTDASEGLSLNQLAQIMADNGATFAYNLDGGGSTTMCFNGQIINNPTGGRGESERKVSDIVYFG